MKTARKGISVLLTLALLLGCMSGLARAEDTASAGKYVQDVFIAYGKTEDEARAWLTANGWEPVNGDFCAGKNSFWDNPIAAVMGIKRTGDAKDAVTDMAVMNMSGGYSFPDYKDLLNKKKAQIDEFIACYMPVIQEYRDNYNGNGSAFGRKRAEQAYELLNNFYDGDPSDPLAVSDTGMKLGDLLLAKTKQEGGGSQAGDLQQIVLESSGAALLVVEQMLALAADTGEETWLARLSGLTGNDLAKNLAKYVPEAAGQNLAASAVKTFLRERFSGAARTIAGQWTDIRDELVWYENYCSDYDLWPEEDEDAEAYTKRVEDSFAKRKQDNKALPKERQIAEVRIDEDYDKLMDTAILYENLYACDYRGEWGNTLGDFFNPYNGKNYGTDADNLLTFAAAMSPGQRASLEMVSLRALLLIGFADEAGFDLAKPDLDALFGETDGQEPLSLSVYDGVNREIFRTGVALTSRARMDQNAGKGSAFDELYDLTGLYAMYGYTAAALGMVTILAGLAVGIKGATSTVVAPTVAAKNAAEKALAQAKAAYSSGAPTDAAKSALQAAEREYDKAINPTQYQLGANGKFIMGIGAILLLVAAFIEMEQLAAYYDRTFTPIPRLIVDEADIVTYGTDAEGNPVESINFDQYVYYSAVRCNRQEVGEISDWQKGVSDYQSWGCGDVADLNGDFGQEWIALYTVKSPKKGDPILADSLTLQYGSSEAPENAPKKLHFFTYDYAADLGDMAYSFNNDKQGVYFFWDSDAKAYDTPKTASAFTGGQLAMSGAAGLLIGILGATAILRPRKRKEQEA